MIYNTASEIDAQLLRKRVEEMISKKKCVNLTIKYPNRSLAQNSYLHVILSYFASEYGCSMEEVKVDFYKRTCNADIFVRSQINKRGYNVPRLRSSSSLSTAEMSLSIDRFRHWSSMVAGIYLPSPEDKEFLIHCENEIEKNKEYLIESNNE